MLYICTINLSQMTTRTVYQKDNIDFTTGEVTSTSRIIKKEIKKETFLMCYIEDICTLAKCPQSEVAIVLGCLKYIEYNTNELVLTAARRKEIAQDINIKDNTFKMGMSRLYKRNIFVKLGEPGYERIYLNPRLFFKGSDLERENVLTLTLQYNLI